MEPYFISTSIICVICFLPIAAPNDSRWSDCVWIRVYLEPLGLEITEKGFAISPEILRAEGFFSLFLAFFTLEETSASTFLAFFFVVCLDNLRLIEVVVMSRSFSFLVIYPLFLRRFQTHSTGLLVAILSACSCLRNSRISFSKSSGVIAGIIVFSSYAITNSVNRTQTWI